MARFIKGDIVVIPFPFSDLSGSKKRPALVVATMQGDDVILCQITGQFTRDDYAIPLTTNEMKQGALNQPVSHIRPNRLFTADSAIINRKVAALKDDTLQEVIDAIIDIIST